MKNRVPTLDEYITEQSQYADVNEGELTRTTDPKAYIAFNETTGPYVARVAIYSNDGNHDETKIFPGIGDKGKKLLCAGPQFRKDIADAFVEMKDENFESVTFGIPDTDSMNIAKKHGFKKKGSSNDFEMEINNPADASKYIIKFLKELMPNFINEK
jgi:hypothetical protein